MPFNKLYYSSPSTTSSSTSTFSTAKATGLDDHFTLGGSRCALNLDHSLIREGPTARSSSLLLLLQGLHLGLQLLLLLGYHSLMASRIRTLVKLLAMPVFESLDRLPGVICSPGLVHCFLVFHFSGLL